MNVICSGAHNSFMAGVFEKLFKEYNVKNLYLYATGKREFEKGNSYLESITRERYDYNDMILCQYDKYLWYDSRLPVDKNLLDKMAAYEPEALKMLERADGNNCSTEKRFMLYHEHLRYWNNFLEHADISLLICGYTPHAGYDYILFRLCQIKNIKTITEEFFPFQTVKSRNRFRLIPSHEYHDDEIVNRIMEYRKSFKSSKDVELPDDLEEEYQYCTNPTPDTSIILDTDENNHLTRNRIQLFKLFAKKRSMKYAIGRAINHVRITIKSKSLVTGYEKLTRSVNYSNRYIFFALHYQPEMTTSPMGGWYVHQYLAIEMLSHYAPRGVLIYVKEHPWMLELPQNTREKELYLCLVKMKNVVLVSMKESTQKLLDNCSAVASITGSVGYEALYKKKPYIMFGYQIMQYGPGTIIVRNNTDCKNAMEQVFRDGIEFDDCDVRIFLKVIGEKTIIFENENKKQKTEKLYELYKDSLGMSF